MEISEQPQLVIIELKKTRLKVSWSHQVLPWESRDEALLGFILLINIRDTQRVFLYRKTYTPL